MHDEDLDSLVRLAQIQGTGPLVYDQLLKTLSITSSPVRQGSMEIEMKQICMQNMVRQEEMKGVMQKTLAALAFGGVHAVVFKGFTLAQLYPNPNLRQWGDIDIYVGDKGYHQTADILRKTWPECPCFESEEDYFKHWNINVGHTAIEAHRVTIAMTHPMDKHLWARLENDGLCHSKEMTVDGLKFNVPEGMFNVLLVFIHSWHHYTESRSANMKQLCDLALLLHSVSLQSADVTIQTHTLLDYLNKNLRKLHLMQVWQAYAYIMVSHLGLPANECPLYTLKVAKRGETLLKHILGYSCKTKTKTKMKTKSNIILRKVNTLHNKINDSMQTWDISPVYSIHDIIGKVLEGLSRFLRGEFNRKWE
ncbi:MAG: nucleotidyltransferase family protein [Paludibacteraceae bacterium]|nr:nucleotidyltransferase family protein [Paludibacteraceae bacterium]